MPIADALEVARLLREYAQRTALRGGNPYRAKAYSRAAESLAALTTPLEQLVKDDELQEIPGIGDAIVGVRGYPRHLCDKGDRRGRPYPCDWISLPCRAA